MAKKRHSKTGQVLKSIFNIRAWLDLDGIKEVFNTIVDTIKRLFIPEIPKQTESLAHVKERLGLTEEGIKERMRVFYRLTMYTLVLAVLVGIYSIHLILIGSYHATCLSLAIMCIVFAFSFRYHFWYFQLKKGKLGCTFKEWLHEGLLGAKK